MRTVHTMRTQRRAKSMNKQKGAVAIMVALLLMMLLSFAALAIDIGNLMVARTQAQTAADAAALAGAQCLYAQASNASCNNATAANPDWNDSQTVAVSFGPKNNVQGAAVQLHSSDVTTGYVNVTNVAAGVSQTTVPVASGKIVPAVQVTVHKDGTDSNGSVPVYLAQVLNVASLKTSATATAVVASPGTAETGALFPIVMSQCLYNSYWNSATNSPLLATSTTDPQAANNGTPIPQTIGQPYIFGIRASYQAANCNAGQWTSLSSANSQLGSDAIVGLMTSGNASPMSIGQPIYVETGLNSNAFHNVGTCSQIPAGSAGSCAWVTVAVVSNVTGGQGTTPPIVAFGCLHILNETGSGSNAVITVQMGNNPNYCKNSQMDGIGPNYGTIMMPRLVQ
ncbi:pilus assembly protein TadG-related protein [Paraburkholderia atlantica]|uniref:pilus assembly protein TadG-related protein n=1 Tax=Paraburkholderia atlantica TaxID=2654982 RepID=UPI001617573B|nr:pilus assembly protein TadG-related protein [Paraburkholderia atlantica]MBB5414637.1 Flp pilus assembly protein TadG [Paraburkholderia atlantica]